jgi:phosphoribosylformimino-5-aminoimidazole carboxamide ribotide isomerase
MRNIYTFKAFATRNHLEDQQSSSTCDCANFFCLAGISKVGGNKLKIIPVLDILDGRVVHAVKGRRKEYKPLKSVLCASSDPIEVAVAFKSCGFSELYVADLDAITKGQPHFSLFKEVANKAGLALMIDAGVTNLKMAKDVLDSAAAKVIIGTEKLPSIDLVEEAIECFGSERVIVSLDLIANKILSKFRLGRLANPLAFFRELETRGVTQIILLDLGRVGSNAGVSRTFPQKIYKKNNTKIFIGGGVRDIGDLIELNDLGVFGVLIATALHSGKISIEKLKLFKLI